ncbi:hemolysin [Bacterioplanes sanyensis]|uniref:Hemolysin n=1 Tax=Bacterioplanes sanyensis TaxID=1249553 RepID=A0A222FM59_9GAMM|nr:CNNM domain-containing protein [Bacterioplanes sanyensis]ASP39604.1 hemolysin [Bacterioplanes sanyensis]
MTLLIVFALLSIVVSFICSVLEASLLSLTPSYIAGLKESRPTLHLRLARLKDALDQPLAAILTLNTIAHTIGAAGVGAQVTKLYGDAYLGAASAVMTLLILVLSEIVPKSLGARYWRQLSPMLPPVLNTMILLLKPFIWLSDILLRLLGSHDHAADLRSEIKAMATLGNELGQLDKDEERAIANILDLHEIRVKDIMVPRTVCTIMSPNDTIENAKRFSRKQPFSRFPVLDNEQEPVGILLRQELYFEEKDPERSIRSLLKPAHVVLDQMNAEQAMGLLLRERQQMLLVYDEYGAWQGLITMEDILETILGHPILDETDTITNMRRFARRRWQYLNRS